MIYIRALKRGPNFMVTIGCRKVNTQAHETMLKAAQRALRQIEKNQYTPELRSRGINIIIELAIVFGCKRVLVHQGS